MSYTGENFAGVGGWLAFLVLTLAVFTPLYMVSGSYFDLYGDPMLAVAYADRWGSVEAVMWAAVVTGLAICWSLTYRLTKVEDWTTVRLTIAGLWMLAAILPAVQLFVISSAVDVSMMTLIQAAPLEVIRPLVIATAWTAYLLMSRRVANTYRPQPEYEDYAESPA